MDRDGLIAVAEDLEFLSRWGDNIADADIRRGSAVLRRLLVEDAYGSAWRAIGFEKQPKVIAVDLHLLIGDNPLHITYALAGGAHFRGIKMACMLMHPGSKPIGQGVPPIRPDGYPCERQFTLSEYLPSLSGIVEGREFNRREVIKYIANVKGGVHLSAQQRKAEQKLIERLGKIEKKVMIHTSDGLLVDLVAMAQAIGGSDDAKAYSDRASNI